jgi:hypothetical protein
MRELIKIFQVT